MASFFEWIANILVFLGFVLSAAGQTATASDLQGRFFLLPPSCMERVFCFGDSELEERRY